MVKLAAHLMVVSGAVTPVIGEGTLFIWGVGPSVEREVERCSRPSGRLVSFSGEGQGSGVLPQSSWHVHHHCGKSAFHSGYF